MYFIHLSKFTTQDPKTKSGFSTKWFFRDFVWCYNSDSTKASNQVPQHLSDLQRPVAKFRPSLDQNCPQQYRSLSVLQLFQNHQKRNQFHHFHKVQRILVQQTIQSHLDRFWIHLASSKYHKESKIKLHMAVIHCQKVSIIDLPVGCPRWKLKLWLSAIFNCPIFNFADRLLTGPEALPMVQRALGSMKNYFRWNSTPVNGYNNRRWTIIWPRRIIWRRNQTSKIEKDEKSFRIGFEIF